MTLLALTVKKRYMDLSKWLLTEERFATLTVSLESEQRQLKADIPELEARLNATTDKDSGLQKFIQRTRQVTRLTELTPEIVHEFIDKIVVSKPERIVCEQLSKKTITEVNNAFLRRA